MTVEEVRKYEADFEEWFAKTGYMLTYPNTEKTVDVNHDMKLAMLSAYLKGVEDGQVIRNTNQYKEILDYKKALGIEKKLNADLISENTELKSKLKWHDFIEDKNDLPKSSDDILLLIRSKAVPANVYYTVGCYENGKFEFAEDDYFEAIAWREIIRL